MSTNTADTETQLITYLSNILKYQIIPMDCMNLRDLVKEAPKQLNLFDFIEEKYPGTLFLDFIKSRPDIFTLDESRCVVLSQGNSFILPSAEETRYPDEVDGCHGEYDRAEYISDPDSDNELLQEEVAPKKIESLSLGTTDSESSVDVFSSELVHTSDSNQSSFSSSTSSDNQV